MTPHKVRNLGARDLARLMSSDIPFINGRMQGIPDEVEDPGELSQGLAERYYADHVNYTVLSFDTPIAWRGRNGWVLTELPAPTPAMTRHMQRVAEAVSLP